MAFAKFEDNRFRILGEIPENHAILVNLTASIVLGLIAGHSRDSVIGCPDHVDC